MKALLQKIREKRILVVGDVMLDHYIHGDSTRISPEAPVPVVNVMRDRHVAGGAANVALNIRSLGASAVLCGLFGEDEAGFDLEKVMKEKSIEFPPSFRRAGIQTIIKSRVVVRNQQLCRIDREQPPSAYALTAPDVRAALLDEVSRADAVIVSDYAKGTIDMDLLSDVLAIAEKRGILVSLDPKPRRRLPFENIGLITPNRNEAIELADIGNEISGTDFPAEEICRRIWEKHHPKLLVITLGADGMLLSREGRVEKLIPTYAREVFDVSGAGDTVIASLTMALAAGADLETAAHFANTAAGIVVAKFGTATVSPEEILAFGDA
ncbi:MAG: D-glycero-beta-D-manno-heptose-7-phosphate kinase [Opitutales bacterium]|nr:D-glycero-beta-D-manno-heptose-7-phosphate kinase [Opitutales bacterium]